MVLMCYETNAASEDSELKYKHYQLSMVDARYRMSGSSGDELEISGVTTGEEEDPDSMDSGHTSPKSYRTQSGLEIIQLTGENHQTPSFSENSHRRKKTPHQYLESSLYQGRDIDEYDQIQNKSHYSPVRVAASSPEEISRYSPRDLSFSDALNKIRPLDNNSNNEAIELKRKTLELRAENLRVKSVESILKNNNKFSDLKDIRLKNQDLVVPAELLVRSGRDGIEGVWARGTVLRGTRYGPFAGKWASVPADIRYAWEVIAGNGVRGWLDASNDSSNWLKFVRSSNNGHEVNLQHVLSAGELWYCVSRNVPVGEELVLGPREPLLLQELLQTHAEERHDKDGSQHSGTVEDDREEDETEDTGELRCTICDHLFQDLDLLDEHLVTAHLYPAGQHRCEACPRAYCFRPGLLRHRAAAHPDLRRYPCENCSKVFTDPSNLQRHIRTHHVGARSHACPECGKTFATSSGLKQHTHIHSSVKPFQCEVCFKAYTQFSNLCRHKRMHADCRMQIKCSKCGQSFSTVTSLSKHKRFCDSTGPAPPPPHSSQVHQMPQLSQLSQLPNMPINNAGQNPFAMYRPTANLPFPFPPNFGAYPGLFPPSTHPGFFPNPLLFNSHLSRNQLDLETSHNSLSSMEKLEKSHMLDGQKRLSDANLDISIHENDLKERAMRSHFEKFVNPKDRFTPPRQQSFLSKVSPPTAEEASSQLLPSPARPPIRSLPTGIFSHPREGISFHSRSLDHGPSKVEMKSPEKSSHYPKDFSKLSKLSPVPKNPEVETNIPRITQNKDEKEKSEVVNGEQPLDLSVARKRTISESVEKEDDEVFIEKSPSVRSSTPETPKKRQKTDDSKSLENETIEVDVEDEKQLSSPRRTPSVEKMPNIPTMVYPRPIHPMFIEAMYRPGFAGFAGSADRLLGPPPSPFGPPRSFPFLGPLLGANGGNRNFDLIRAPLPSYGNKYQDVLLGANHGGKLKDRYACKFCGKVFPRSANLTRHLRTHTGEQPYKCKYCERSFSISSNLQRHVRNIHNKEKPFKCNLCDRCFGQQTNLDRHLKKHEAEEAGVGPIADSPGSSNETEREDAYFDEIRSFMGKVTYGSQDPYLSPPMPFTHFSRQANNHKDHDDDSESYASEEMSHDSLKIKQEKEELLNNNDAAIEVST